MAGDAGAAIAADWFEERMALRLDCASSVENAQPRPRLRSQEWPAGCARRRGTTTGLSLEPAR